VEFGTLSLKENVLIKFKEMNENLKAFEELLNIMDELRL